MKKVLVTGGAGFIGSHLCRKILEEGHEVLCLDNFFTGRKKNIVPLMDNPRFEIIRHDIVTPVIIEADEVYHLACPASPVHYQFNAIKTIKTNVMGSLNVLGIAKRTGARCLITSTSEVYGDPKVHPQPETYWGNVNPIGLRSCYDEGKRVAETLFMEYHRSQNVDIRIARIFNTYGPHMCPDDGRVVSNFIVQALKGENITIYGDGSQTRSFCYVDDMVRGLMALMNQQNTIGPVNLGNQGEFTIKELAQKILEKTDSSSKIIYKELPPDDPKIRRPDISKAKKDLGWDVSVPLDEGLTPTIEYFRSELEN